MKRRMIIAAGGQARRFGGLPKELLPTNLGECCFTRAVKLGRQLGDPVIITNAPKHHLHEDVLHEANLLERCEFREQDPAREPELWGAIQLGLESHRAGGLILADTVTAIAALPDYERRPDYGKIQFGVFETTTPERFSVIEPKSENGCKYTSIEIKTKKPGTPTRSMMPAWGVILWDKEVTDFLISHRKQFDHYDRAFQEAANRFGSNIFWLSYYFDLGTFASYLEFLAMTHWPQTNK